MTDLQDSNGDNMNNKPNQVPEMDEIIDDLELKINVDKLPVQMLIFNDDERVIVADFIKSLLSLSNKRAELKSAYIVSKGIADKLYERLPSGDIDAFELLKEFKLAIDFCNEIARLNESELNQLKVVK